MLLIRHHLKTILPIHHYCTSYISDFIPTKKLIFSKHGNPRNVVEMVDETLATTSIEDDQVLVSVIATPINPSDINQIEGTYMHLPKLPATPGNEFVGQVLKTGNKVTKVTTGDRIIAAAPGLGTWRTHLIASESQLQKVPIGIPINFAATLLVNPCSAYRMLQDFVPLRVGDVVIQNAANSGVGQMAIQLSKYKGVKTINVVREREDFDAVQKYLHDLGANLVVTDKQIRLPKEKSKILEQFGRAKLALNAVGGKSINDLSGYVQQKGTIVTYGAMSKEPNVIPAGKFIFMDHRYVGYWNTRWIEENYQSKEYRRMIEGLCQLSMDGRIKEPLMEKFSLERFRDAIERYFTPFTNQKQYFSNVVDLDLD